MADEMHKELPHVTDRRKRRYDPLRRERLIAVTLEAIGKYGVAGTTSRKVAKMADVSLGSLTYYFESINELLEEAFVQLSLTISSEFRELLGAARNREEALTAVVDIIDKKIWGSPQTLTLSFELYAFVSRNPKLKNLPREWMNQSRQALEQHFTPSTARAIDALIEGIGIHNFFDEKPMTRLEIEKIVKKVASEE
ncbi:TetR family transcriptional regulator [Pantoea cypripedii]|uniref:TetR/AcrR family transcriptional regulator n=1 Tax=Pantoea cypripedii TaxID=55209 RepID=UPI002FC7D2EA